MKRSIRIGKHSIPLWLVLVLLLSGIVLGVVGDYVWRTITISLEIKEPLEILSYPSQLSLFAGETKEFNITLMNHASRNYTIILDFSLDNETYQNNYVTFSDETYIIVTGQQNITAWFEVKPYAPPINASITINFQRIKGQVLFFDDFNDGLADGWTEQLGTWNVFNEEYFTSLGIVENGISTIDDLTLTDGTIQIKLRFRDTSVGFRAGIVFRYTDNEHHYALEISDEYDEVAFHKYTPEAPGYGVPPQYGPGHVEWSIHPNVNYTLRVEISGNTFTGFLNGKEILSVTDDDYQSGKIGLRARNADVFFDDFTVTRTS